jgi:DNA invertase Pin-like site-specific DNA recombinase
MPALRRWAQVYRQRNELIRAASAAGVGVNEIARITGIAKTTVIRVLRE